MGSYASNVTYYNTFIVYIGVNLVCLSNVSQPAQSLIDDIINEVLFSLGTRRSEMDGQDV